MKKKLIIVVIILLFSQLSFSQYIDSTTFNAKFSEFEKKYNDLLNENISLRQDLDVQKQIVYDVANYNTFTHETVWNTIKGNLINSSIVYKLLSEKIINLKAQIKIQNYQNYIKTLGSVENNPLGFSFKEIILETAQDLVLFNKKHKAENFIKI